MNLSLKTRKRLARICSFIEASLTMAMTDSEYNWIDAKWDARFGIIV